MLDVFSSQHGRLSLIAKGVKNKKNRSNSLIQPSQRLNIAWSIRGELGTLTGIELAGALLAFSGTTQVAIFYLNELLIRLLHQHEPHPELFNCYDKTLLSLNEGGSLDLKLRIFEKKLLEDLGYGLILDHDVETGEQISSTIGYYYQVDYGPTKAQPATGEYIQISGKTLLSLQQELLDDLDSLNEAKHLMRVSLSRYLGNKPLASRELYRAYIKQAQDN